MTCIYFALDGQSGHFKIGKANDSAARMRTHKTSNPSLKLCRTYETPNAKECEKFLKSFLCAKRVPGTREFFRLTQEDISEAVAVLTQYESERLPKEKSAEQLKNVVSNGTLLTPAERERQLYQQLRSLYDEIERLKLRSVEVESEFKAIIGNADGIKDIATWKSQIREGFDFKVFENENPIFIAEHEDLFRKYRTRTICRPFKLK